MLQASAGFQDPDPVPSEFFSAAEPSFSSTSSQQQAWGEPGCHNQEGAQRTAAPVTASALQEDLLCLKEFLTDCLLSPTVLPLPQSSESMEEALDSEETLTQEKADNFEVVDTKDPGHP